MKLEDNRYIHKNSDGSIAYARDREYCKKESVDRTAYRIRREQEMGGKQISYSDAHRQAQAMAHRRDLERQYKK